MNNRECRSREDKFFEQGSFFTGLSPAAHVTTEVSLIFHELCLWVACSYTAQVTNHQVVIPRESGLGQYISCAAYPDSSEPHKP